MRLKKVKKMIRGGGNILKLPLSPKAELNLQVSAQKKNGQWVLRGGNSIYVRLAEFLRGFLSFLAFNSGIAI